MLKSRNVLYVHYGDNWIRGSEACLIQLLESLNRTLYTPFVWSNCQPLVTKSQTLGIHSQHSVFPIIAGWQAPRFDVFSWYSLINQARIYLREHNIDLIHVNSGAPCQWMCLAARLEGVPLITQLHSDYQRRDRLTLGLHMSPHIVCVSQAISNNLIRDGYPRNRLNVIHNGVKSVKHEPLDVRKMLSIAPNSFVFITVGSLIKRKGIDLILKALGLIEPAGEVHLIVVGDGEERANIEKQVNQQNMADRVHLVGEQHNVSAWLEGGANAFISGARDEAFGLVLAEAGLARLPVIAPRVGGIPEFITHNSTGLLYSASNPVADMASQMLTLISDPKLRSTLAENLYQKASNDLTIATNTRAFEALYHRVCQQFSARKVPLSHSFKPLLHWVTR